MNIELLINILDVAGTLLIAWAALRVHHRVLNEHKIDQQVFTTMRIEQRFGILGMLLVLAAFILRLFF